MFRNNLHVAGTSAVTIKKEHFKYITDMLITGYLGEPKSSDYSQKLSSLHKLINGLDPNDKELGKLVCPYHSSDTTNIFIASCHSLLKNHQNALINEASHKFSSIRANLASLLVKLNTLRADLKQLFDYAENTKHQMKRCVSAPARISNPKLQNLYKEGSNILLQIQRLSLNTIHKISDSIKKAEIFEELVDEEIYSLKFSTQLTELEKGVYTTNHSKVPK